MFWRFGIRPPDGGDPPLSFDELQHCIRNADGPWVQLPRNSALILALLLRMHVRGRTVSTREICAFLKLPEGTRIGGYVTDLRKKLAECGADPNLIGSAQSNGGYCLATDIDAISVAEAEELKIIERMLAHPEVTPNVRIQLKQLYAMLALSAAVVLGFASASWLKPASDDPIGEHEPEEGSLSRTLLPDPTVHAFISPAEGGSLKKTAGGYEAILRRDPTADVPAELCFELQRELDLHDDDVLAIELALMPPTTAARIAISVERVPPQAIASVSFDMTPASGPTFRVPATQITPDLRAHARTICFGEDKDVPGSEAGEVGIRVWAVRVE